MVPIWPRKLARSRKEEREPMKEEREPMKSESRRWLVAAVGLIVVLAVVWAVWERQEDGTYTVGIATLMKHPALDEVQAGLLAELGARGFQEGENLTLVHVNANGQVAAAASLARDLVARQPDAIVAITTPMAQAIAGVAKCPVVFAAVTDPVGAGLVPSLEEPQEAITGTSDAWPYEAQMKLIREIVPKARSLGVLYNPGEAAGEYGFRRIKALAPAYGFEVVAGAVNTTGEVFAAARDLADRADVLFLSSDNTAIAGVAGAVKVAVDRQKPLFVGDSGTVVKGGIGAVSVGYEELGRITGDLLVRTLQGERFLPVVVSRGAEVHLNSHAAELMGVSLPEETLKRARKIHDKIE